MQTMKSAPGSHVDGQLKMLSFSHIHIKDRPTKGAIRGDTQNEFCNL